MNELNEGMSIRREGRGGEDWPVRVISPLRLVTGVFGVNDDVGRKDGPGVVNDHLVVVEVHSRLTPDRVKALRGAREAQIVGLGAVLFARQNLADEHGSTLGSSRNVVIALAAGGSGVDAAAIALPFVGGGLGQLEPAAKNAAHVAVVEVAELGTLRRTPELTCQTCAVEQLMLVAQNVALPSAVGLDLAPVLGIPRCSPRRVVYLEHRLHRYVHSRALLPLIEELPLHADPPLLRRRQLDHCPQTIHIHTLSIKSLRTNEFTSKTKHDSLRGTGHRNTHDNGRSSNYC